MGRSRNVERLRCGYLCAMQVGGGLGWGAGSRELRAPAAATGSQAGEPAVVLPQCSQAPPAACGCRILHAKRPPPILKRWQRCCRSLAALGQPLRPLIYRRQGWAAAAECMEGCSASGLSCNSLVPCGMLTCCPAAAVVLHYNAAVAAWGAAAGCLRAGFSTRPYYQDLLPSIACAPQFEPACEPFMAPCPTPMHHAPLPISPLSEHSHTNVESLSLCRARERFIASSCTITAT